MLITMKTTARGVADGFTCKEYMAGETYDMADGLAAHFVNRGYAEMATPRMSHDKWSDCMLEAIKRNGGNNASGALFDVFTSIVAEHDAQLPKESA